MRPALAYHLGAGFVPVRKPKKLPSATEKISYELEYGLDTLEVHKDAISKGTRVLIADDLLATGGTALAAAIWSNAWEARLRATRSLSNWNFSRAAIA